MSTCGWRSDGTHGAGDQPLPRGAGGADHSLALEHHEGVNSLHTTSCWEDQQWIDVQFSQTSIEMHGQVGDLDQNLRQRFDVRCRPSTEPV